MKGCLLPATIHDVIKGYQSTEKVAFVFIPSVTSVLLLAVRCHWKDPEMLEIRTSLVVKHSTTEEVLTN